MRVPRRRSVLAAILMTSLFVIVVKQLRHRDVTEVKLNNNRYPAADKPSRLVAEQAQAKWIKSSSASPTTTVTSSGLCDQSE